MLRKFFSIKRPVLLALPFLLAASCVALINHSSAGEKPKSEPSQPPASLRASSEVSYNQYVRVWVHADSVSTDIGRVRPGKVILVAENQTHCGINLVLQRVVAGQASQVITAVTASSLDQRAQQVLLLTAGEYVLYEQSNPEAQTTLLVESE